MSLDLRLSNGRDAVLADASAALARADVARYTRVDADITAQRMATLFQTVVTSLRDHQLVELTRAIDALAVERYTSGYRIHEVQTAINALADSIWRHLVATADGETDVPAELAAVSTVLGAAKDRLAQTYVELAAHGHAPAVDVAALAAGAGA